VGSYAYKEWDVIVRALLHGEQILDVRKGGIREPGGHFDVRASHCWLVPTYEHQHPELVKAAYRRWIDPDHHDPSPDTTVTIEGWADITGRLHVDDPDELAKLESKLIWTPAYAESRLRWKAHDPLTVLALRVHRLDTPVELPWRAAYGGCTSWFETDDLPDDPAALPSELALSDTSYASRIELIERDLGRSFAPIAG
jgi:hypothetical protein